MVGLLPTNGQITFQERLGTIHNEWGFGIAAADNSEFMLYAVLPYQGSDSTFTLIRTDSLGNVRWAKEYSTTHRISCRHFIKTSDNNFIVAGDVLLGGSPVSSRLMVLKIDTIGNILWQATYAISSQFFNGSIHETSDKGFILASFTLTTDFLMTKVDRNGVMQWCKSFSIPNTMCWYAVTSQIADNGYLYYGGVFDQSTGELTNLIAKFDSSGNMIRSNKFKDGMDVFNQSDFYKIDSNAYLLPCSVGNMGFDSTGNFLWENTLIGGLFNQNASCKLANNHLAFTGNGGDSMWASSYFYLEIDSTNSIVKSKTFATSFTWDYGMAICPSTDNGAALLGYSYNPDFLPDSSDIYLIKVDSSTITECNQTNVFSFYSYGLDSLFPIVLPTSDLFPLLINDTITITPITFNQEVFCINTSISEIQSFQSDISISPNPFTNEVKIQSSERGEVLLYDLTGKEILRQEKSEGQTTISTVKISPGLYLLHYCDAKTTANFKVIKQ
jgi:hypothetical protein